MAEKFSVTKIERSNGAWEQRLLDEGLTFYEAYDMVVDLRGFMNHLMESEYAPRERTYYRMGRPH